MKVKLILPAFFSALLSINAQYHVCDYAPNICTFNSNQTLGVCHKIISGIFDSFECTCIEGLSEKIQVPSEISIFPKSQRPCVAINDQSHFSSDDDNAKKIKITEKNALTYFNQINLLVFEFPEPKPKKINRYWEICQEILNYEQCLQKHEEISRDFRQNKEIYLSKYDGLSDFSEEISDVAIRAEIDLAERNMKLLSDFYLLLD